MGTPRKRWASDSVATLLISTQLRGVRWFSIGKSTKAVDRVFGNIQRPLLSVHSVMVRITGIVMTWSVLGGLRVNLCVLLTMWFVLTVIS